MAVRGFRRRLRVLVRLQALLPALRQASRRRVMGEAPREKTPRPLRRRDRVRRIFAVLIGRSLAPPAVLTAVHPRRVWLLRSFRVPGPVRRL